MLLCNFVGGLQFTLSQIGTSLSIVGAFLLPFSLVFYPFVSPCMIMHDKPIHYVICFFQIERKVGTRKALLLGLFTLTFFLTLTPNIHYLVNVNQ